jgi:hypothetical protein
MIEEHRKAGGGELSEGNILLITDGQDSISVKAIQDARDKIGSEVNIAVNAITIYDGNDDIKNIIATHAGKSETLGRLAYHHINPTMLLELLDTKRRLELLQEVMEADEKSGNLEIKMGDLIRFQEDLTALGSRKGLNDPFVAVSMDDTLKQFEKRGSVKESQVLADWFDVFFKMVEGPVSTRWTRDIKLSVLSTFIDTLVKQLKVDAREVIHQIPFATHQKLMQWLKKKEVMGP